MAFNPALELDRRYGWLYRARPHASRHTYFLSLSVFRVLFGFYILLDFIINTVPWFRDFYSIDGIFPAYVLPAGQRSYSAFFMPFVWQFNSDVFLWAVMFALPLAAVMFTAGYRTRLATIVLLVCELYFDAQNRAITYGATSLVIMLLYWCMFCPMARYLSLEAVLNRLPKDRPYPALPIMLLHGQISLMYLAAAAYKLAGPEWLGGTAVAQTLTGNIYAGSRLDWWLLLHGGGLLPLVTWGIMVFQISFPFLVHSPWYNSYTRALALTGGLMMHLGFLVLMDVGSLPYLCMIYLTLIVPDAAWMALGRHLPHLKVEWMRAYVCRSLPEYAPAPVAPWAVALAGGLFIFSILPLVWGLPRPAFESEKFQKAANIFAHGESPERLRVWVRKLGLRQDGWNFFAPHVNKFNRSYGLTGVTDDGRNIDLMSRWSSYPLRVDPTVDKVYFASHYWLRYFNTISLPGMQSSRRRAAFLNYLCRKMNESPKETPVKSVTYHVYWLWRDHQTGRVTGQQAILTQTRACEGER